MPKNLFAFLFAEMHYIAWRWNSILHNQVDEFKILKKKKKKVAEFNTRMMCIIQSFGAPFKLFGTNGGNFDILNLKFMLILTLMSN